MSTTSRLIVKDKGLKAIQRRLGRQLDGLSIRAGVMGTKALEKYDKNDETVAQIAAWQEFGTRTNTARPFLREAFSKHKGWRKELRILGDATLAGADSFSVATALALKIAQDIKTTIEEDFPGKYPNADSVQAYKGKNTPLIDTGKLMDSISAAVDNGKKQVFDTRTDGGPDE